MNNPGTSYKGLTHWMSIIIVIVFSGMTSCKKLDPERIVKIETGPITDVSYNTCSMAGTILDIDKNGISEHGFCWSTNHNPTVIGFNLKLGVKNSKGNFQGTLTGLKAGTTYYVKAYTTNITGTLYGNEVEIKTISSVTDIDGNTYPVVTIGTQIWMAKNLQTTHFKTSAAIPLETDNNAWYNLSTPAYCWYANDEATYKNLYGALYNWHAVNTGNLCPTGWHIPTDLEWDVLQAYLIVSGFNYDGTTTANKIAKSMVSITNWAQNTVPGTPGNTDYPQKRNATGLNVFPGGSREGGGSFLDIGISGKIWSSTETGAGYAWWRLINYDRADLIRIDSYLACGFSVRCIKD